MTCPEKQMFLDELDAIVCLMIGLLGLTITIGPARSLLLLLKMRQGSKMKLTGIPEGKAWPILRRSDRPLPPP